MHAPCPSAVCAQMKSSRQGSTSLQVFSAAGRTFSRRQAANGLRAARHALKPCRIAMVPHVSPCRRSAQLPEHMLRGFCDPLFAVARCRTISAYAERSARPHPTDVWTNMAEAPAGRRTFAGRVLVSRLFGFCHYDRLRTGGDLGSRTIHDAVVWCSNGQHHSGVCHHGGCVLLRTHGNHFVRAHSLGPSRATSRTIPLTEEERHNSKSAPIISTSPPSQLLRPHSHRHRQGSEECNCGSRQMRTRPRLGQSAYRSPRWNRECQ
jgi:hypothetical protein